jgi:hypothetical protein
VQLFGSLQIGTDLLLVAGCWLLDAGCLLLVACCLLLVSGFRFAWLRFLPCKNWSIRQLVNWFIDNW